MDSNVRGLGLPARSCPRIRRLKIPALQNPWNISFPISEASLVWIHGEQRGGFCQRHWFKAAHAVPRSDVAAQRARCWPSCRWNCTVGHLLP